MRIADLARAAGTTPRMLRYYEREGLLEPGRGANGYREYSDAEVQVVHQIVALAEAGLTVAAIRTVLPCAAPDGSALYACPKVEPELRSQLATIHRRIEALTASATSIEHYLDRLQPSAPSPVPLRTNSVG